MKNCKKCGTPFEGANWMVTCPDCYRHQETVPAENSKNRALVYERQHPFVKPERGCPEVARKALDECRKILGMRR